MTGMIVKIVSEFCYVQVKAEQYACKAKGLLRFKQEKPTVGDMVDFDVIAPDEKVGHIISLHPRKNELYRPRIANVDRVVVVMSLVEPDFSHFLLNKFLTYVKSCHIATFVLFTKTDLIDAEKLLELKAQYLTWYEQFNYRYQLISNKLHDAKTIGVIGELLSGQVAVFMGQTGAGKSSTLNMLFGQSELAATQAISKALNRGKHTTTSVQLYALSDFLIGDTPGFASLRLDNVAANELSRYWPGVSDINEECRFRDCMHVVETGCAVKQAVEQNRLATFFYDDYLKELNLKKER